MDLHEQEERDFGRDGDLWDANPDVCCAAFQLGACSHTEADPQDDPTWGEVAEGWDPDVDGQGNEGLAAALDRIAAERRAARLATDEEPF